MKRITALKNFIQGLSKKQIIFSCLGILIAGGVVYGFAKGGAAPTLVSAEVGNIEEEVLVTGSTKSSYTVNLGFERSGKVVQAGVEVG
ncbi:MAG: hypothetical protein V4465_02180, partial [Patescibacteria group bacterium]